MAMLVNLTWLGKQSRHNQGRQIRQGEQEQAEMDIELIDEDVPDLSGGRRRLLFVRSLNAFFLKESRLQSPAAGETLIPPSTQVPHQTSARYCGSLDYYGSLATTFHALG
jgi:hypothetical protein